MLRVMETMEAKFKFPSERNNISNCDKDHSYMTSKNEIAFCTCPKNLPEAKSERFELILLVNEIFKYQKYTRRKDSIFNKWYLEK